MTLKYFIISSLVVVLVISSAQAQLGLGILKGGFDAYHIHGTLFCTLRNHNDVQVDTTPTFPNAHMKLMCEEEEIANAGSDDHGAFAFTTDRLDAAPMLNGCNLVVTTPLRNCNTTLPPNGYLVSPLQLGGVNRIGTQNIAKIIPSGFHFKP